MNHILEHLPDQHATLSYVRKIINEDGLLVVRIPTVTSDAFDIYQKNWYQLDAPRHLYLHSHKSIMELLSRYGFKVTELSCDSTIWQYYSSEPYAKGIPFYKHMAYFIRTLPLNIITGKFFQYKKLKNSVNKMLRGDQIVVIAKTS